MQPKLRTVSKVEEPYPLNKFPAGFIKTFSEGIAYLYVTKRKMSLVGEEWEELFSECVNADWKPSNVGLDDVQLGTACWSAKTVMASKNDIANQKTVRLISGRCSPQFSYDESYQDMADNLDVIGPQVLEIWNARVDYVRSRFKTARVVVLVKGRDYSEYLIYESELLRFNPDKYYFAWNNNKNLEGFDKITDEKKFVWQPHGSQFTIIESIPPDRMHIRLKLPDNKLNKKKVLETIDFDEGWFVVVDSVEI